MYIYTTLPDKDSSNRLFSFLSITEEEVIKAIKEKKNTDFCGIYELYSHDKLKKECLNI
jgi:hypothetical protein